MNTGKLINELNNLKDNVIGLYRHNNLGVFLKEETDLTNEIFTETDFDWWN